jgi:hypothetical protein
MVSQREDSQRPVSCNSLGATSLFQGVQTGGRNPSCSWSRRLDASALDAAQKAGPGAPNQAPKVLRNPARLTGGVRILPRHMRSSPRKRAKPTRSLDSCPCASGSDCAVKEEPVQGHADLGQDIVFMERRGCQNVPLYPEQRHNRRVSPKNEAHSAPGLWISELRELPLAGPGTLRIVLMKTTRKQSLFTLCPFLWRRPDVLRLRKAIKAKSRKAFWALRDFVRFSNGAEFGISELSHAGKISVRSCW